jgi:hypothetical protein
VAYNVKKTNTVLRVSYARVLETPFNENLILSSVGCNNAVLNPLLGCFEAAQPTPLASRMAQRVSRRHPTGVRALSRILRRIHLEVHPQRIRLQHPGEYSDHVSGRVGSLQNSGMVSVPNLHGFSALAVFSSVAARFFTPQIGGAGAVPSTVLAAGSTPFRIDHDEKFNLTTHFQYQPWKTGPWLGFNWRYDSGLVAGQTPCYGGNCAQTTTDSTGVPAIALTDSFGVPLTADQEFESGLFCGSQRATPTMQIGVAGPSGSPSLVCPLSAPFGSTLLQVPAPNTENDDKNPPRIASRSLFDIAVGHDNLFPGDKYKVSLQFTAINITNKYALYNFLSTFSGTHYVTPRTLTAQIGFNF